MGGAGVLVELAGDAAVVLAIWGPVGPLLNLTFASMGALEELPLMMLKANAMAVLEQCPILMEAAALLPFEMEWQALMMQFEREAADQLLVPRRREEEAHFSSD
jgi:hypothetical protein